jgi:two-component system sensor histidine kinase UhpB
MDLSRAARADHVLPPTEAVLNTALADIDGLVGVVRRIAQDLRPSVLDDFGLVPALEAAFDSFLSRSGLTGSFHSEAAEFAIAAEAATACFRIFQEALTNIARHAEATEVNVTLVTHGRYVVLEIRDNGRGMPAEAMTGVRSLGLTGMRERAQLMAGELRIDTGLGRGTVILVKVPLQIAA